MTGSSNPPLMPKDILDDICRLIDETRSAVATTVNAGLTMLYWRIGKRIDMESFTAVVEGMCNQK